MLLFDSAGSGRLAAHADRPACRRRTVRGGVMLPVLLALAACGGGSGGSASPPVVTGPTPTPSPAPTPTPTPTAGSATVSYLYTFQTVPTAGGQPNGPLVQASDGNFYGTTRAGGANRCFALDNFCGTIFRMTPAGVATDIYSFGASATDGYTAGGALIQGRDGALYGTTASGGAYGGGTVFKITLAGVYTILHSFGATPTDGAVPVAALVQGSDGEFYGTTASGGANHCNNIPQSGGNCGTVFKITAAGVETVLYSFGAAPSDGIEPTGTLIQASDGNFYGTTVNGGVNACSTTGETHDCGTVFRITPAGAVTVLYSFGASATDAIAPQGSLIQGSDGALYGTTVSGGGGRCGSLFGCGTVFRLTMTGSLTILYAFSLDTKTDGYGPSSLILGRDGNFYGTTGSGGATPADLDGTAFRLTPAGVKTILYSFGPLNTNPSKPVGGLIQGADGAFYGITAYSGSTTGGTGTVYKLVP